MLLDTSHRNLNTNYLPTDQEVLCGTGLKLGETDDEGWLTLADALVYACNKGVHKVILKICAIFYDVHMFACSYDGFDKNMRWWRILFIKT